MQEKVSRRTLTKVAPASLLAFGNRSASFAQIPEASPEEEQLPDLIDRLAAADPETTLDLLLATPFEADWLVPGATDPPIQPQPVELIVDKASEGEVIGAVSLPQPSRDATMGGFVVFANDTLAAADIEEPVASTPIDMVQHVTLAGLDGAMVRTADGHANVVLQARYVEIISSPNVLTGPVVQDHYSAQIRALQHALGLIWHLHRALGRS